MKLQTHIPFSQEKQVINYNSKVLLLGSCFSENIGNKLDYFKFQHLQNPFGIVFHPLAIENLLTRAINQTTFTAADVFERDGSWYCFETHSSFTAPTATALVTLLNVQLKEFSAYLLEATHLIMTLGTAWVYRYIASDTIVANCHKVPQKAFLKELLSVAAISASIERSVVLLKEVNPTIQVISTVSPVRHLKDGFIENSRSKSHLITGVHESFTALPRSYAKEMYYFPSYEIMLDELRDYRFYAADMLHPNTTAINYIWEKFKEVWIAAETEVLQKQIDTIQKGLQHKPFNLASESHLKFKENLQQQIENVQHQLPFVVF